jgi:hypothetical protein
MVVVVVQIFEVVPDKFNIDRICSQVICSFQKRDYKMTVDKIQKTVVVMYPCYMCLNGSELHKC